MRRVAIPGNGWLPCTEEGIGTSSTWEGGHAWGGNASELILRHSVLEEVCYIHGAEGPEPRMPR